ncbi:MAG: GNAT family N-acetyltransferase [Bacteroidales bacterium]|nr:GNAT family N-acetyltransferase [Bacteroidales bacterium]
MMINRISFSDSEFKKLALPIRTKVFVDEQKVPSELEYDGADEQARHYILYLDEKPIGTARWRETNEGIKLERFAVLKQYRNKNYGSGLLKAVLQDIIPLNKPIYLHAQLKAVPYYERQGFVKVGEKFVEAGIEHYLMQYDKK